MEIPKMAALKNKCRYAFVAAIIHAISGLHRAHHSIRRILSTHAIIRAAIHIAGASGITVALMQAIVRIAAAIYTRGNTCV
jgi:hypothetical protein